MRPSGIRILEATLRGSTLKIVCVGVWGYGSLGNGSGALVKKTIEEKLAEAGGGTNAIILDYQRVHYEWGDGMIWSLYPAILKEVGVTIYGNLQNAASIQSAIDSLGGAWTENLRLRVKSE